MWYKFLIVAIMVGIKAIFSASDTAFTYINKYKVSQLSKKDKKAKKIKYLIDEKIKFYGIIEVVITMIELLVSAYASEAFVNQLAERLQILNISIEMSIIFSIVIVTVLLSYVLLIFGGILPKQIARNYPEKTAYRLINILWIVAKLNYPFEWLIRKSTKIFSKIFNIQDNPKDQLTEKEIKMMIAEGKNQGVIDGIEKTIALRALKFENILVKNIMIKKENIDFINVADSKKKVLENIETYNYTRMPVYKGSIDNVIGVFNIKDLIIEYAKTKQIDIDIQKYVRDIIFVEKEEKISNLFRKMQTKNLSMAVVIDDKKVIGIVTLEDIIKKLVGKIFDEYDIIEQQNK